LLITSRESRPALSAIIFGIDSRDLANMFITNCYFPSFLTAFYFKYLDSYIYVAPPPATTLFVLKHLLTIIMASFRDLSASLINCSAPPLKIMVADLAFGQFSNKLYLYAPICFSSKFSHVPSTSGVMLLTVVWRTAPVAFETLLMSSLDTLPAQKIPLSANHCVARSPIGNLDKTMSAPTYFIF
jgi:hypothetical protein